MTLAVSVFAAPASAAESSEFRIARQPDLVYLRAIVVEDEKLIEKHAAAPGLKDLKVNWSVITSGDVMTEAILSDSIDMATTGLSNMLLALGKINGQIKTVTGRGRDRDDLSAAREFGESEKSAGE